MAAAAADSGGTSPGEPAPAPALNASALPVLTHRLEWLLLPGA